MSNPFNTAENEAQKFSEVGQFDLATVVATNTSENLIAVEIRNEGTDDPFPVSVPEDTAVPPVDSLVVIGYTKGDRMFLASTIQSPDKSTTPGGSSAFSVSDGGTLVVDEPTDLNFTTNINVTDDSDGTVSIDVPGGLEEVDTGTETVDTSDGSSDTFIIDVSGTTTTGDFIVTAHVSSNESNVASGTNVSGTGANDIRITLEYNPDGGGWEVTIFAAADTTTGPVDITWTVWDVSGSGSGSGGEFISQIATGTVTVADNDFVDVATGHTTEIDTIEVYVGLDSQVGTDVLFSRSENDGNDAVFYVPWWDDSAGEWKIFIELNSIGESLDLRWVLADVGFTT